MNAFGVIYPEWLSMTLTAAPLGVPQVNVMLRVGCFFLSPCFRGKPKGTHTSGRVRTENPSEVGHPESSGTTFCPSGLEWWFGGLPRATFSVWFQKEVAHTPKPGLEFRA